MNPTKSSVFLPTLAILTTVVFWGMSFVSSKVILNAGVPPLTMVFLRFLCASVILLPIFKRVQPGHRIQPGQRLPLILSGLFGVTIYFFFEATGIRLTSASSASMITATIPIFTILAEFLFYKTRVPWYKGIGVALSIIGVYFILQRSQHQGTPQSLTGNLLMLGACMSWVTYIMLSKNLKKSFSGLALTTYQTLCGTLFLLPLALLEYRQWVPIGLTTWLNILYLAIFCSALGFFLYIYALSKLGSVVISSYINLIPVVSVTGGIILLKESIGPYQILGGITIIAGVFVVNLRSRAGILQKKNYKRPLNKEI